MRNLVHLRLAVLAAALPLASACTSGPFLPVARQELAEARLRWERAGIGDYQFTVTRLCFCPLQPMRVTVVNGAVVSRVFTANGQPVPADRYTDLDTVDELFELLEDALDKKPAGFEASYHDQLGYPVSAFIDWSANTADEESGFQVADFAASAP